MQTGLVSMSAKGVGEFSSSWSRPILMMYPAGGVYSVGLLDLGGGSISGNRAPNGAAIYYVAPTDGSGAYCHIAGDDGGTPGAYGPTAINGNCTNANCTSGPGYSIVAGDSDGLIGNADGPVKCSFTGVDINFVTAAKNSLPTCQPGIVHPSSRCPQ